MKEFINKDVYDAAKETFGLHNQVVVCIEELSELQKELSKYLRDDGDVWKIGDEIADVAIMLEQMIQFFNLQLVVDGRKAYKTERLKSRIANKKQNGEG